MDNGFDKIFFGTLVKIESVAQGVKKFSIKIDRDFKYISGQYIWLEIPQLLVNDLKGSRRAFSILNIPNSENIVEIVGRIGESGYKQTLFGLKKGATVKVHGPFGSSYILQQNKEVATINMIAGGVGIAPFLPILNEITNKALPIKCFLVYLNNDKESTPFLAELELIKKKNKNFEFIVLYNKFSWADIAEKIQLGDVKISWWVSGPQGMVNHVFQILENGGISITDMVFESFYPENKINLTRDVLSKQLGVGSIFAKAIQYSTNHSVITDLNGTVLYANSAAEKITGYTNSEILGNTPRLWGGLMSHEFYVDFWKKKFSGEPFQGEIINRRKNGEIYYAIAHIAPIFDEENHLIGFIGTEEDITEMKKKDAEVRASELRLKFALEGSRDGMWEWDLVTNKAIFSQIFYEIVGLTIENGFTDRESWKKIIHREDLEFVEKMIDLHLTGQAPFYEAKYRVLLPDGGYRWVLDRGMVAERGGDNKPTRFIGTYSDITEEKERERELELMNSAMIDREIVMIDLKKKLKELENK